ncbi:hypothetical protein TTHERM_00149920 (macronuclear) [Tetrahymena thermophila SB210]|uniref:Uncharacterized protein n=1 Tax=Tetrahymena thermophila (strain SB210) TaxID=312017 RepID=I7ML87_TETTS|nr:hypothetical protein TTHERM_00149920 [Tetrahymena thermophila SB210]EAS01381.2 hypothetical protein TTHERM_00149920 [Tetrahymena thermophila SB210]|eukprot:XP_001021627.2 hypothetical protein TTHERM_00149920 [Tetrahymena thermophila SB210]
MSQINSDLQQYSKGFEGNNMRRNLPYNLNLNIANARQRTNDLQNSNLKQKQEQQQEDKAHKIQTSQKLMQKSCNINNSKFDTYSSNDSSPFKINDYGVVQKNMTNQSNNSFGSDILIQKQNSNNSSDKYLNEKPSPSKFSKSKFNYLINESPLCSSNDQKNGKMSQGNAYLFNNNNEFALDQNNNRDTSIQAKKELFLSKMQTQASENTSSQQNTKQYFFQKCVSELNSPQAYFPNQKLNSYGMSKEQFYTNNAKTCIFDYQRSKSKQNSSNNEFSNSNSQNFNYYNITNNQFNQAIELPKLANKSRSVNKLPLNLTTKQQYRQNKDKCLNSLSEFDDIYYEEKSQNQQTKKYDSSNTQINLVNRINSKSMSNLTFGVLDRQSINHSQYQQRQKLLRQREKEEYMQEEVAKVKQLWQQYELQRIKNKEYKQQQIWQKSEHDGSIESPLKYQRQEQLKDLKTKHIENKKQQFFNEMISSVKKSAISTNQNTSLVQSPLEGQGFLFSARKVSNTFTSTSPESALIQKEDVNAKQSPTLIANKSGELLESDKQPYQSFNQQLDTQQISKTQSNMIISPETTNNKEEEFWESIHIWENIIKDSFEIIKKEKIVSSQEFNYQLFLDFLNNVVGRNYQNNEKYMRESLKLIGFTPEVSEIVLERISRLMSEKYGISNDQISKFSSLYNQYEKEYLSWNLIDRMGGKERISEVINTYIQLVNSNPSINGAFRLLNISNDSIGLAFNQLLHFEERRHKQYFKSVQNFFKQPLYRVSHTKFFYATKLYFERAMFKNKIQPQYKNRLFLLIEQMRYFVTLPLPQDMNLLLPKQNKSINSDQSSSPTQKNQNENKVTDTYTQKTEQNVEDSNNDEQTTIPQFCYQIAAIMRSEMMAMIKIKQALIKHQSISLNNKVVFEQYLTQLIQIFALNNNDSIAYFELKNSEKYRTILLLTDDFFYIFSKLLMENLIKNFHCSIYFSKDTHKRLQHVKIQLNKLNAQHQTKQDSYFSVQANIESNYLNGSCFFHELFNHPNPIELILDRLDDIYHNKSELNKLCPFSKVSRSRDLCRHILSYFYPFVDQNGYPVDISSFDFQCYISQKKLKYEFFVELKKVLKDLFLSYFNFPITLVQRLIQEYQYAIHGIEYFQKGDNGNLFGIRSQEKAVKDLNYNNQYDDEKLEF